MTENTKNKFIKLRSQGKSIKAIAKELKTSELTLIEFGKEYQEEITNKKTLELDDLKVKYSLTEKGKIEIIGTILSKIKKEIEKRDLSEVPTDKLINLYIKLMPFIEKQEHIHFIGTTEKNLDSIFKVQESWTL